MATLLGDITSGLAQSKLRSVTTKAPAPSADAGASSSETIALRRGFSLESGDDAEILKYQKYILRFNIEVWLDALGDDDTFGSVNLEFGPDVAREFVRRYEWMKEHKEIARSVLPDRYLILHGALQGDDLEEDYPGLNELRGRLEQAFGEGGAFVKTSSRSAKDFADLAVLQQAYNTCLQRLLGAEATNENARLIAMSYASMSLLKSDDALGVINTFSQSERIWHDMMLATAAQEGGQEAGATGAAAAAADEASPWLESLVVRRWVDIEPDMEFRCFVAGGTMTAISQYRHLIHFPRLCSNWTEGARFMEALTKAFETSIKQKLDGLFPNDDYILDLAIQLDESQSISNILSSDSLEPEVVTKVWVVEANPFFETTDGCLFSWRNDIDQILGEKPLEARLTLGPKKGASSLIYRDWKRIMDGEDDAIPGPDLGASHRVGGV